METLAGQVVAVDVDAGATLGAMREGIARQTGIIVRQQRLIILGVAALCTAHQASHEERPCCCGALMLMLCEVHAVPPLHPDELWCQAAAEQISQRLQRDLGREL